MRFRKNPLQKRPRCAILAVSNLYENQTILIIQKDFPMKQNVELQVPATGKVLFKLTLIGCLLLGCVYGFLVLFNTAMAAIK